MEQTGKNIHGRSLCFELNIHPGVRSKKAETGSRHILEALKNRLQVLRLPSQHSAVLLLCLSNMYQRIRSNKSKMKTHIHKQSMHIGQQNSHPPQKLDTSSDIPLHTLCCLTDWYRPPSLAIAHYTKTSYCCPITQSQPYYRQSSWSPPLHRPKHALLQTQFVTISSQTKRHACSNLHIHTHIHSAQTHVHV